MKVVELVLHVGQWLDSLCIYRCHRTSRPAVAMMQQIPFLCLSCLSTHAFTITKKVMLLLVEHMMPFRPYLGTFNWPVMY